MLKLHECAQTEADAVCAAEAGGADKSASLKAEADDFTSVGPRVSVSRDMLPSSSDQHGAFPPPARGGGSCRTQHCFS